MCRQLHSQAGPLYTLSITGAVIADVHLPPQKAGGSNSTGTTYEGHEPRLLGANSSGHCWQEAYAAPYGSRFQPTLLCSQLPPTTTMPWGPCRGARASGTLPGSGLGSATRGCSWTRHIPSPGSCLGLSQKDVPSPGPARAAPGQRHRQSRQVFLRYLLPGLQAFATQQSSGIALLSCWLSSHCLRW